MIKRNKIMLYSSLALSSVVTVFGAEDPSEALGEGMEVTHSFFSALADYVIGFLGIIAFFGLALNITKFFFARKGDNAEAMKNAQDSMKMWAIGFILLLFLLGAKAFFFGLGS